MALTLRDRQREYYFEKLDEHYPGLSEKYRRAYGESPQNVPSNIRALEAHFTRLCKQYGIATRVPRYTPPPEPEQMTLF